MLLSNRMSAYHSLLMVYYHYTTSGHQCQIIVGYGARRWSRTITWQILSLLPLPIGLYELNVGVRGRSRTYIAQVLNLSPLPIGLHGLVGADWSVESESNRPKWFCRPSPSRSVIDTNLVAGVGVEPTETGLWAPSEYRFSLRSGRWYWNRTNDLLRVKQALSHLS